MSIGTKLKQMRTLLGLTQEELADRCELTKGYISQLENDLTSPSISTLTDILAALGSSLTIFFSEPDEEQISFNQEHYIVKESSSHQITWLVPNSQKNEMEPILCSIAPFSKTDLDMPHEGQEFGYVLKGEVTLVYGSRNLICQEGTTFYFTTNKNHYIKNNSEQTATILWVSSPPNF